MAAEDKDSDMDKKVKVSWSDQADEHEQTVMADAAAGSEVKDELPGAVDKPVKTASEVTVENYVKVEEAKTEAVEEEGQPSQPSGIPIPQDCP